MDALAVDADVVVCARVVRCVVCVEPRVHLQCLQPVGPVTRLTTAPGLHTHGGTTGQVDGTAELGVRAPIVVVARGVVIVRGAVVTVLGETVDAGGEHRHRKQLLRSR